MGDKEKMNWADVIGNAVHIMQERDKYAYWYGAKGQTLTREVMKQLVAAEPEYYSRYSAKKLRELMDWSEGKIGLDCSGFINAITGQANYSTGYFEESVNKTDPVSGTWGNILYTTHGGKGRHIGLDIGQGRFLHMPKEGESVTMGIIRLYDWEASGQIKGVSYYLTGNK